MRRAIALLILLYLASDAVLCFTRVEIWERDKQAHVIFPAGLPLLYYAYRPLTYLDSTVTGMRFHIGPHR